MKGQYLCILHLAHDGLLDTANLLFIEVNLLIQ